MEKREKKKADPFAAAVRSYISYIDIEKSLANTTIDNYNRDLHSFVAFLQDRGCHVPKDMTSAHLLDYLASEKTASKTPSTIARRMSAIRGWCGFLLMENLIDTDISQNMQTPRMKNPFPSVLNMRNTEALLALPDMSTVFGIRDSAMLEFLYSCGMRVSELTALTVHDIDCKQGLLRCLGKGDKERVIPVGDYALAALELYLSDSRPKLLRIKQTQELFLNRLGDKLSRSGLWLIVEGYGKRLGLDIHPHTLRHSAATHMLDNGADLRIVQEFLGHSNISTTQIYTNLSRSELKSTYLQFHPHYHNKEK